MVLSLKSFTWNLYNGHTFSCRFLHRILKASPRGKNQRTLDRLLNFTTLDKMKSPIVLFIVNNSGFLRVSTYNLFRKPSVVGFCIKYLQFPQRDKLKNTVRY